MDLKTILWIGCGAIWAVLLILFVLVTLINRYRNRERKDK